MGIQKEKTYLNPMVSFINNLIAQATTLKVEKARLKAREREVEATHKHELDIEGLKHHHESERDEADRQHQLHLEEQRRRYENERDAVAIETRRKEEWLRHVYQSQQAKGGLIIEPGLWKSQVFAPHQDGPFVLFDTLSPNQFSQSKLPFDPIQFLAEQFKLQSQVDGHYIKTMTIHEGFNSDSHARQFLKREFAEDSVALVYATFSGNRLSFHTLYNGLTADQLLILKDEGLIARIPERMHYALLGRFPFSLFRDLALRYGLQEKHQPQIDSTDQKVYEDAEFLFDLIVNTSLQALIDQFVACQPFLPYMPRALKLFQEKSDRIKELGFWHDDLAEQIELLNLKFNSLRAQSLGGFAP